MRRVNSRGKDQATKHVLMAALTYNASAMLGANIKKNLAWTSQKSIVKAMERQVPLNTLKNTIKRSFKSLLSRANVLWNLWWQNREIYMVRVN